MRLTDDGETCLRFRSFLMLELWDRFFSFCKSLEGEVACEGGEMNVVRAWCFQYQNILATNFCFVMHGPHQNNASPNSELLGLTFFATFSPFI